MMKADMERCGLNVDLVPDPPGLRDPAKFLLGGLPARVILRFEGWHLDWVCFLDRLSSEDEQTAHFRWADEPQTLHPLPSRVFQLDNATTLDIPEHQVDA